jgi:hypothetical protein
MRDGARAVPPQPTAREAGRGRQFAPRQDLGPHRERLERAAQIVAQHRDELLAQLGRLARVEQRLRRGGLRPLRGELHPDELGEELEHRQGPRRREIDRPRVERAHRAEVLYFREEDRHRDVALERVHLRRRMRAVHRVLAGVADDDGSARR